MRTTVEFRSRAITLGGLMCAALAWMAPNASAASSASSPARAVASVTYVCNMRAEIGAPPLASTLNGTHLRTSDAAREPIHAMVLIKVPVFDKKAQITGTAYHEGIRSCQIPITAGRLNLDSNDVGTLTLTAKLAGLTDEQGDLSCSTLFGGRTIATQVYHAIRAQSGEIRVVGEENFLPPRATGTAYVPVEGNCVRK